MAGTVVVHKEAYFGRSLAVVTKCTSNSSGAVSGTGVMIQGGQLYAMSYLPVSGASDNWDITVTGNYYLPDGSSIQWADLLGGQGANLSNSTNGDWLSLTKPAPIFPSMLVTPVIAGLGDTQAVWIVFHIWEEVS